MPPHGLPQFFLSALLLCADPVTPQSYEKDAVRPEEDNSIASALAEDLPAESEAQVVASSPLPAGFHIGSHFGHRISPRTGERTFHAGADFFAPRGTPVYAVRAGVVEHVAHNVRGGRGFGGYGNAVVVHHPDLNRWTFYAHLTNVTVREGQYLQPGERLGTVGNTSNGRFTMVPHLHFEVRTATATGGSPFPGAYRDYNENPGQWLASLGVHYEADGAHDDANVTEASEPAPVLVMADDRAQLALVAQADVGVATF